MRRLGILLLALPTVVGWQPQSLICLRRHAASCQPRLSSVFDGLKDEHRDVGMNNGNTIATSQSVIGASLSDLMQRQISAAMLALLVVSAPVSLSVPTLSVSLGPLQHQQQQEGRQSRMLPDLPHLHRSDALALSEEQQLVVDVWREVNRQFVDGTFNGMGEEGWKKQKLIAVKSLADKEGNQQEAYKAIRSMLATLNDPYTRFLEPAQYEALSSVARGASAGIGVQLQLDPDQGRVIILGTVKGGPAALGGVVPGDEVLEVDGESMSGATAELAAAKMRGPPGTLVSLSVKRSANSKSAAVEKFSLERAAVKVSPVEVELVSVGDESTGAAKQLGVVRIASFSQETGKQLLEAVRDVTLRVDALVVDLRGNAGGYMPAGVEAAKLFLPPNAKIISEVRRDGTAETFFSEGIGSETKTPLYLLVDARTASASEIMAAALQDNGRAKLVGPPGTTFGKGRIQNVQQLEDGSGVAVTKAKYVTPSGKDIHGIGLTPDYTSTSCGANDPAKACIEVVPLQ